MSRCLNTSTYLTAVLSPSGISCAQSKKSDFTTQRKSWSLYSRSMMRMDQVTSITKSSRLSYSEIEILSRDSKSRGYPSTLRTAKSKYLCLTLLGSPSFSMHSARKSRSAAPRASSVWQDFSGLWTTTTLVLFLALSLKRLAAISRQR